MKLPARNRTVRLSRELERALEARAVREHTHASAVMREAIERHLGLLDHMDAIAARVTNITTAQVDKNEAAIAEMRAENDRLTSIVSALLERMEAGEPCAAAPVIDAKEQALLDHLNLLSPRKE